MARPLQIAFAGHKDIWGHISCILNKPSSTFHQEFAIKALEHNRNTKKMQSPQG